MKFAFIAAAAAAVVSAVSGNVHDDIARLEKDVASMASGLHSSTPSTPSFLATGEEEECEVRAVLTVDVSSSIRGAAISGMRSAAKGAYDLLMKNPKNQVGVVQFRNKGEKLVDMAHHAAWPEVLDKKGALCHTRKGDECECPPGACTNLNDGLMKALDVVEANGRSDGYSKPYAIFVITDGMPNIGGNIIRSNVLARAIRYKAYFYFLTVGTNEAKFDRIFTKLGDSAVKEHAYMFRNVAKAPTYAAAISAVENWVKKACNPPTENPPEEKTEPIPEPEKNEPAMAPVYFDTNEWKLNNKYMPQEAVEFKETMLSKPCKEAEVIFIRGFASPSGSATHNYWLSLMRLASAADALVRHSVTKVENIRIWAGGEDDGGGTLDATSDAAQSRRVEAYCNCKPPGWKVEAVKAMDDKAAQCTNCEPSLPGYPSLGSVEAPLSKIHNDLAIPEGLPECVY